MMDWETIIFITGSAAIYSKQISSPIAESIAWECPDVSRPDNRDLGICCLTLTSRRWQIIPIYVKLHRQVNLYIKLLCLKIGSLSSKWILVLGLQHDNNDTQKWQSYQQKTGRKGLRVFYYFIWFPLLSMPMVSLLIVKIVFHRYLW